jgi:hypothetical protein
MAESGSSLLFDGELGSTVPLLESDINFIFHLVI